MTPLDPKLDKESENFGRNCKNESIFSLRMVQKGLKMIQNHSKVIKYSPWEPNLAFTTNLLTFFRHRFAFKTLLKLKFE